MPYKRISLYFSDAFARSITSAVYALYGLDISSIFAVASSVKLVAFVYLSSFHTYDLTFELY